jgi:hypothetical protein
LDTAPSQLKNLSSQIPIGAVNGNNILRLAARR